MNIKVFFLKINGLSKPNGQKTLIKTVFKHNPTSAAQPKAVLKVFFCLRAHLVFAVSAEGPQTSASMRCQGSSMNYSFTFGTRTFSS